MSSVISVENLSKKYIIGHQRQERYTALRDVLSDGAKRLTHKLIHPFATPENDPTHEEFWALKDVSFDITARRPGGHHRAQWRGQVHPAENPEPHYRADIRQGFDQRPGSQSAGSRHRLSSGTHRSGKHLSEWRNPRHEQNRYQEKIRRDRRLCRSGKISRYARKALLIRHVCPVGVCSGCPSGAGDT